MLQCHLVLWQVSAVQGEVLLQEQALPDLSTVLGRREGRKNPCHLIMHDLLKSTMPCTFAVVDGLVYTGLQAVTSVVSSGTYSANADRQAEEDVAVTLIYTGKRGSARVVCW